MYEPLPQLATRVFRMEDWAEGSKARQALAAASAGVARRGAVRRGAVQGGGR